MAISSHIKQHSPQQTHCQAFFKLAWANSILSMDRCKRYYQRDTAKSKNDRCPGNVSREVHLYRWQVNKSSGVTNLWRKHFISCLRQDAQEGDGGNSEAKNWPFSFQYFEMSMKSEIKYPPPCGVDRVVVDQELVEQVVVVDATEARIHNSLNSPTLDRPKLHPNE